MLLKSHFAKVYMINPIFGTPNVQMVVVSLLKFVETQQCFWDEQQIETGGGSPCFGGDGKGEGYKGLMFFEIKISSYLKNGTNLNKSCIC